MWRGAARDRAAETSGRAQDEDCHGWLNKARARRLHGPGLCWRAAAGAMVSLGELVPSTRHWAYRSVAGGEGLGSFMAAGSIVVRSAVAAAISRIWTRWAALILICLHDRGNLMLSIWAVPAPASSGQDHHLSRT